MPEPRVISVMNAFKQDLLAREATQIATMTRKWMVVERSLKAQIAALSEEIARTATSGTTMTVTQIERLERYQELLAQVRIEVSRYETWASGAITQAQQVSAQAGIEQAVATIDAALADYNVTISFNKLPVVATEYMVGLAGDGSPLFDVLAQRALWPDAIDGLTDALVKGVAQGWGPRKTALRMADGLSDGLQKGLVISRTEQLRVYRAASDAEFRASGVVQDKVRVAAKEDGRTCLACLAADGQVLALNEPMYDHVCGRCLAIPRCVGLPPIEFTKGPEWFIGLSEDRQREIMGGALYKQWDGGKGFDFAALATHTDDPTWGRSLQVTPLGELA